MWRRGGLPLVSVVLTTHERPEFLPVALACHHHQTYPRKELIVVDDGAVHPVPRSDIGRAGGRLLYVPPGTPLGTKLNNGLGVASGEYCLKMDDDDWYAPEFLERMMAALRKRTRKVRCSVVAALSPFLFFDLARWQIRRSVDPGVSGATLVFRLEDWRAVPFRPISRLVDAGFIEDQTTAGAELLRVHALESFLQVRHRDHIWKDEGDGFPFDEYLQALARYKQAPEALLPAWAKDQYARIRSSA
jgi:glycosyltransferase involved in cell wall biosynthesis